jgi:hypothetical protein
VFVDLFGYPYTEIVAQDVFWRFADKLLNELHGIASVALEVTVSFIGL